MKKLLITAVVLLTATVCFAKIDYEDMNAPDFYYEISSGRVYGMSAVNKFGRAVNGIQTTGTDIWDRADATPTQQVWTAPTQARNHIIVSTSANDDGDPVGTGARTIRLYGLADWNSAETSEDITMNGTTGVSTSGNFVIIHRMKVLTKGASGPNVGVITATAGGDGTITAQINAGEGQTQMAIYGIPSTKTAYMTQYYGTINKASGADATINFSLLVNPGPDSELTAFVVKNTRGVQSTGSSSPVPWSFKPFFKIDGPAIIKIQGVASSADVEGSAGFDLILTDN